jgi:uncharacterized membrane protein YczE
VLGIGWVLGGVVGVGTVIYALAIGPLLHLLLPRLEVQSPSQAGVREIFDEELAEHEEGR